MNEKVEKDSTKKASAIVVVIASLYIITAIIHINTLVTGKDQYFDLYSYMPHWLAAARYSFSWFQRILALTTVIGLLFHKEIFRKILIGICIFTSVTVYWKHPYTAFLTHTKNILKTRGLEEYFASGSSMIISVEQLTVLTIIVHSLLNIAFCALVIYFLTRPTVKKLFVPK